MQVLFLALLLAGLLYAGGLSVLARRRQYGVPLPWRDTGVTGGRAQPALAEERFEVSLIATVRAVPPWITILAASAFGAGLGGTLLSALADWPVELIVAGAIVAGLAEAFVAGVVLSKLEAVSVASRAAPAGTVARVCIAIGPRRIGAVVYRQQGVERTVSARSSNGQQIAVNTEVVVTRYEQGIAIVVPATRYSPNGKGPHA